MSTTRPEYRESKKPTAVCVYTIAQESRYVIVENISIHASTQDLIKHVSQYGQVQDYRMLDTHVSSTDECNVTLIQFTEINDARYAKRKLDEKPFFYLPLRVNYAPEYETPSDIRAKFQSRYQAIHKRLDNVIRKRKRNHLTASTQQQQETIYGPILKPRQSIPESNDEVKKKRRRRI